MKFFVFFTTPLVGRNEQCIAICAMPDVIGMGAGHGRIYPEGARERLPIMVVNTAQFGAVEPETESSGKPTDLICRW